MLHVKKYAPIAIAISITFAALSLASATAQERRRESGFLPLFANPDWTIINGKQDTWAVTDTGTIITLSGEGGWWMTKKEYADFELRLEYKMCKGGNSGIAIRSPLHGDPTDTGLQIQIQDDDSFEQMRPNQLTGSIYDVVPSSKQPCKPIGEWNELVITARGRQITVELNGIKVVDANLDDHKDKMVKDLKTTFRDHPGLLRPKGHIGLESYSKRVEFRNLRIKEINKDAR